MSRVEHIGLATRTTAIYALCEYPSWRPRYVGKTVMYLHERHKAHIRNAKRGHLPVNRWLRKRIEAGDRLAIKLIEYVQPGGDWAARERHWIATYREEQPDLLNLCDGGEGLPGHTFSTEHRAKIASALRTGAAFNCEVCGTSFWRKQRDIRKGNCRFCSRSCYAASLKGVSRPLPNTATAKGVAAAAAKRRAQTHCKRGHSLADAYISPRGIRVCRECRKVHKAAYRERAHG